MNDTLTKSQNTNIKIRSYNKFVFVCNNHYDGEWVQIPGSPERTWRQDEADCKQKEWLVYQVEVPVGDKYVDYIYESYVNPVKGYTFIEDPYLENGKAAYDNNKKLNYHFANFKKGDQIPLEYIIWQWVHKRPDDISQGIFSLVVTKENFHIIQWLLQAIYNDLKQEFCSLPPQVLNGLFYSLKGEKGLVKMPDKWANSIVGEFNVLESNAEFIQDSIRKMEAELEEKKRLLESAKSLTTSKQFIAKPTVTDEEGQTTTSSIADVVNEVTSLISDTEDVTALVEKAIDLGVLKQSGAFYNLNGKNFGPGVQKAIAKFTDDLACRSDLKEALSKVAVLV